MVKLIRRYPFIPACATFGPLAMSRFGGLMDGWIGVAVSLFGVCMLSAALLTLFRISAEPAVFE